MADMASAEGHSNLRPSAKAQAFKVLREIVWQALDFDMLDGAYFAAEQLWAMDKENSDSCHLLGLVLYRQGKFKSAAHITYTDKHVGCAYIFAKCSLKLKMYKKGIELLEKVWSQWSKGAAKCQSSDTERSVIPDKSVVETILGHLYSKLGDKQAAAKSHVQSAKSNPYLWESVAVMAEMGLNLVPKNIFPTLKSDALEDDPFAPPKGIHKPPMLFKTGQNFLKKNNTSHGDIYKTPTADGRGMDSDQHMSTPSDGSRKVAAQPLAPQKRSARNLSTSTESRPPSFEPPPPPGNRRQMRASTTAKRTAITATSKHNNSTLGTAASLSTAGTSRSRLRAEKEAVDLNEGSDYITKLYRTCAAAYSHLHRYQMAKAGKFLQLLPLEHQTSYWAIAMKGRAAFEQVDYTRAASEFEKLRELDPGRTEDMDMYSTLLWHLRSEVDLAWIARELIDVDRKSPQAWVALGNCFSLQKDPDQALKCFNRAIQLDPDSPYAYTLAAHEYIANDALENALDNFRLAIRAKNRHYNAWYGLGMVCMRLGNIDQAELHFQRASSINPDNVVLICCLGMVHEKREDYKLALEQYTRACEIQPVSALSKYKRARTLLKLDHLHEALREFTELVELAPSEAGVHLMLAQLYKVLRQPNQAVKHFTIALNLDPKGSHFIKENLEGLASHVSDMQDFDDQLEPQSTRDVL